MVGLSPRCAQSRNRPCLEKTEAADGRGDKSTGGAECQRGCPGELLESIGLRCAGSAGPVCISDAPPVSLVLK